MSHSVKPYHLCASRLEQRGGEPPTREDVDALVEAVQTTGVEAIIHSAVSQKCQPLFPSKVFPNCHADADLDGFAYLIERMHVRGRPVLSWYSLNHSRSIVDAYPDWRMLPMRTEDEIPDDENEYCCINSPYGDLLAEFAAEIVRDVGFDGLWFDGNAFAIKNAHPGCRCEFCKKQFRDDTGLTLPEGIDFANADFRRWVTWRYERWTGQWRKLLASIKNVRPDATMALNNYRRWGNGAWYQGIPLNKLKMDVLMSGELDLHVFHGDFQMKMHRAYECGRGQDTWLALCDNWNFWVPDVETLPVEQAAVATAAGGGVLWMGCGFDPRLSPQVFRAAQEATAPLMPYIDGDPVEHVAVWVSQQTQDFHYTDSPGDAWHDWHGGNELCLHTHVQSSIVFDDHVTDGDIVGKAPVLLAGNTACVSAAQATQIRAFVEQGGLLIACADFAGKDHWGQPYDKPILDDLLGIESRQPGEGSATLELLDDELIAACGQWVSCHDANHTLAVPTGDVQLLSHVVDHPMASWDGLEFDGEKRTRHAGMWYRSHGKGGVLYLGANLPGSHIRATTTFQVRLFKALLDKFAPPSVTLQGPLQVTMNVRTQQADQLIVHLHNAPGTVWRYTSYHNSGELLPVHDLTLVVRDGGVRGARSALTAGEFVVEKGQFIRIPKLHRNDVLLIDLV